MYIICHSTKRLKDIFSFKIQGKTIRYVLFAQANESCKILPQIQILYLQAWHSSLNLPFAVVMIVILIAKTIMANIHVKHYY